MTKTATDKIAAGLDDAIDIARGDAEGKVTITQNRGPTIEFVGELLASVEFTTGTRAPMKMRMEIWETRGGALIAATYNAPAHGEGFVDSRATVVEPIYDFAPHNTFVEEVDEHGIKVLRCVPADRSKRTPDEARMRRAVLEHFQWDNRARKMALKLGWSLKREVE